MRDGEGIGSVALQMPGCLGARRSEPSAALVVHAELHDRASGNAMPIPANRSRKTQYQCLWLALSAGKQDHALPTGNCGIQYEVGRRLGRRGTMATAGAETVPRSPASG